MEINFLSSKDSKDFYETSMHTKSNNIEMIIGNETDEITEEFLNLFWKDIKKD